MSRVDIVTPVRNEEHTIPLFLDRLSGLALPHGVDLKVIFVEDSSTDGTRPLLRRLAVERSDVGYYSLVRGFGQALAVSYGISRSTADAIIMMDVDGSHPLEVIPDLVRGFLAGARVVQCVRRSLPKRTALRRVGAATFHFVASLLTGTDTTEQNIFYRLVSADVAQELLRHPRYLTYLRFPLPRQPPEALQLIYVDTVERVADESKYNLRRLLKIAIEGILSQISSRRLVGFMVGLGVAAVSLVASGYWVLAAVLTSFGLWVVVRFRALGRPVLSRLQVLESGNVAASGSSPQAGQGGSPALTTSMTRG